MAECGLEYDMQRPGWVSTVQEYEKLRASSPSSLIDHVQTATLVMVGRGDRRVPPTQGMNWCYALRGRRVECQMLVFEETGHALDTVEAEKYGFEAAVAFMMRAIN